MKQGCSRESWKQRRLDRDFEPAPSGRDP